jgi:hypothetical protein
MTYTGHLIDSMTDSVKRAEENAVSAALIELEGTRCFCGNHKKSMHSFCHFCYVKLPGYMKNTLWRTIREGYVGALVEAKEFLRKKAGG